MHLPGYQDWRGSEPDFSIGYDEAAMKVTSATLITSGAVLAIAGCSLTLQISLFNDTGQAIRVNSEGHGITVEPGLSAMLKYPGDEQNWMLHLSTATCDYAYQVARKLDHFRPPPGQDVPVKAQVERDFSIYLLPLAATAVAPIEQLGAIQRDGFPLHPSSKACR
jgi:hypothetical protein